MASVVNNENDADILRLDLDRLAKWSNRWLMEFNTDKCKILHLGSNNPECSFSLNNKSLGNSCSERDLGIIVDNTMKFSEHCNVVASRANSVLGMIKRTITCKRKDIIVKLYKALVRPKLEYCVQAWRPYLKKDIAKLEKVQARATRIIMECRSFKYRNRLELTGLTTLEERRDRGDLIEVFKLLKGFTRVDYKRWFTLLEGSRTRGHSFKLVKDRCRLDVRRNFFSQRVINNWNKLPSFVAESTSINMFKIDMTIT